MDSSVLVAITFQEDGSEALQDWLNDFDGLMCSELVEAEVRSACSRERVTIDPTIFSDIDWILPNRRISGEIASVLSTGHLTGADLWHVATALYFSPEPSDLVFLTLDMRQRNVADAVGFRVERVPSREDSR